jgi:hypothetical protein
LCLYLLPEQTASQLMTFCSDKTHPCQPAAGGQHCQAVPGKGDFLP